jgi:hypothetical protein
MKIALLVAAGIAVLLILFILHTRLVQNPRVLAELERAPDGERAGRVLVLTLPSGETIPVNYWIDPGEVDRSIVYAASDFFWWRELRGAGARVGIVLRGRPRVGHARAIEDDPARRERVYAGLRPTAPKWFGVLIEIVLDADPDADPELE